MLYNIDGEVYCSDANSTAFQYPLTHAKIVKGNGLRRRPCQFQQIVVSVAACCLGEAGPAVEVPLDGTIYDLETGKVHFFGTSCHHQVKWAPYALS